MKPFKTSMTVQVFAVVLPSPPRKRLTSQNPESLTCDRTVAPEAIATTTTAGTTEDGLGPTGAAGAIRPPPW